MACVDSFAKKKKQSRILRYVDDEFKKIMKLLFTLYRFGRDSKHGNKTTGCHKE